MKKKIFLYHGVIIFCGCLANRKYGKIIDGLAASVLILLGGIAFADDARGFTATADVDANALEIKSSNYSNFDERQYAHGTTSIMYPFGGFNYKDDTNVSFSYDGGFYGGKLSLNDLAEDNGDGVGGVKAWVMPFGPVLKISAGTDIGSGYADSLGADPGMRIYNGGIPSAWDANKNPDNITQDKGLLLEFNIAPVMIAMAGQYHASQVLSLEIPNSGHSGWIDVDQRSYGYGMRIGSEIGSIGKVNVSYINQYTNIGANNYRVNRNNEAVPAVADAKTGLHMFGAYASLKPLENFSFSIGYNGIYTKYLDEFYSGAVMVKTLLPQIFQNAVNLNIRYTGIQKTMLRTDHNISFWHDSDYRIFNVPGWENNGLNSESLGSDYADVNHLLLWNGFGGAYEFSNKVKFDFYMRNLLRRDTAFQKSGSEYVRITDKVVIDAKTFFNLHKSVELYAGITFENMITISSKDINAQIANKFTTGTEPKSTTDTETVIKIPVGIKIRLE
ncbi:MAG: hypothetical protein LBU18_07875 [Treponema sp.]|jgi:hypothetical protein|nr:hypothetical protein [Treponema sp.]